MGSVEEQAERREAEALAVLRRANRRKWLVGALIVLVVPAWFVWPMLRPSCTKARAEICRTLLVSCQRTSAGLASDPPPHEWCEQFLDASFLSDRDRAAQTVLGRYPEAELTEAEMADLRARSGRGRYGPVP